MNKYISIICIASLSLSLNACQLFQNKEDNHYAYCKEVRNQMMFNGATSHQGEAWKDRSERAKLFETYHTQGC